ncbi:hypothetical protein BDV93DRAFT_602784 [Ceratobasidium sp. AG-I]|nr:hypothetical protein BDV93DRAFT_602784 [Ceratobasidium sp. AG-I]
MSSSPLQRSTCVLNLVHEPASEITRFILVSSVVDLTWNLELGCQGVADRWWRGSHPLPDAANQSELAGLLSNGDVRITGWKGTESRCMLKVTFDIPLCKKFNVALKEYDTEEAATRAMHFLFEIAHKPIEEKTSATSSRNLKNIPASDIKPKAREQQTIQELRRKVSTLEKALECRPTTEAPPIAPRRAPTIPRGASLANPSKRRRVVKDMRFDGE